LTETAQRTARYDGGGALPVTLARLTGEFLDLANLLADTDPTDAQGVAQIEKLLDGSAAAIQEKAASIASLVREFDARAVAAQAEADRIMAHARAATSRARL
jgi:Siphovirus Gp157